MNNKIIKIAIDGYAGTGKSTTADVLAAKLNLNRLNSGIIYRAITFILHKQFNANYCFESENIKNFIKNLSLKINKTTIYYKINETKYEIQIEKDLRSNFINNNVSSVAKIDYIREHVKKLQLEIIKSSKLGIVVDGRDIGSNVMKDADLKVFLTASPEIRAKRRLKEDGGNYDQVLNDIKNRDNDDITRKIDPLIKCDDAVLIKNDNMTIEEVVNLIILCCISKKIKVKN